MGIGGRRGSVSSWISRRKLNLDLVSTVQKVSMATHFSLASRFDVDQLYSVPSQSRNAATEATTQNELCKPASAAFATESRASKDSNMVHSHLADAWWHAAADPQPRCFAAPGSPVTALARAVKDMEVSGLETRSSPKPQAPDDVTLAQGGLAVISLATV